MAEGADSYLYLIRCEETGRVKIGRSLNPERRLRELQGASPTRLRLCVVVSGGGHLEGAVHEKCGDYALNGEWFEPEVLQEIKRYVTVEDAFRYLVEDLQAKHGRQRERRVHGRLFRVRRGRLLQAPGGNPWVLSKSMSCPSCNGDPAERSLGDTPSGQVSTCGGDCSRKWRVVRNISADEITSRWAFWTRDAGDNRPLALDVQLWSSAGWYTEGPPALDGMGVLLVAKDRCAHFCDQPVGVGSQDYLRGGDHKYCSGCDTLGSPPPRVATIPHPDGGGAVDCTVTDELQERLSPLL